MAPVIDVALPLLVVIVMTIVGLELRGADFLRVREYPVLVPAIVVGQWIALTAVAGLVGLLPGLPQAVAAGALLVAAAPVATLSNYYTHLAAGDYRIGITMPGVPGLVMGRTSRIAFGFTYGFMDMVDFFVDEVRGSAVRRGERFEPIAVRQERSAARAPSRSW